MKNRVPRTFDRVEMALKAVPGDGPTRYCDVCGHQDDELLVLMVALDRSPATRWCLYCRRCARLLRKVLPPALAQDIAP